MASGTRGFLFADLRGYTRFADTRGDRAAAELLAAYRAAVRTVIRDFEGAEIRTEGDSFYVVFPSATSAVEAGLEILARTATASSPDLPIRVGVGVHAGETVETTEGLVGTAVNIAARVCAAADAGELLVTGTVRSLTRTMLPYRFVSLGARHFKGVDEAIPIFRVEALASRRLTRLRRQLRSRRRAVFATVGLLAVGSVAAAGAYVSQRGIDCRAPDPRLQDAVAAIDAVRGCVVATVPVGRRPAGVAVGDGHVWVASRTDQTVTILDPTGSVIRTTAAGGEPDVVVPGATGLYVLHTFDGILSQIRYREQALAETFPLPVDPKLPDTSAQIVHHGYQAAAFANDSLWFANRSAGELLRLRSQYEWSFVQVEPAARVDTGEVGRVDAGTGPVATDNGLVWVANFETSGLARLEPGATRPVIIRQLDHGGSTSMIAAFGSVWTTHDDGTVVRTDGFGHSLAIHVGAEPVALAASTDAVWVADDVAGTVVRIDPATNSVTATIRVGSAPAGVAVLGDRVWVSLGGQ